MSRRFTPQLENGRHTLTLRQWNTTSKPLGFATLALPFLSLISGPDLEAWPMVGSPRSFFSRTLTHRKAWAWYHHYHTFEGKLYHLWLWLRKKNAKAVCTTCFINQKLFAVQIWVRIILCVRANFKSYKIKLINTNFSDAQWVIRYS